VNCLECGTSLSEGSKFCPACGTSAEKDWESAIPAPGRRKPGAASHLIRPTDPPLSPHLCWLNLFCPGIAQLILGQLWKGLLIIGFATLFGLAMSRFPASVMSFAAFGILIGSTVDAYMVGKALKFGTSIGKWDWFPRK
jgi:hypothetical protein